MKCPLPHGIFKSPKEVLTSGIIRLITVLNFRTIDEGELLREIDGLNADPNVHGIIVQMPLDADEDIDAHLVTNRVAAAKDVDGLSIVNEGKVAVNDMADSFVPCTPAGCMDLIARSGVKVEGANAVVIGDCCPVLVELRFPNCGRNGNLALSMILILNKFLHNFSSSKEYCGMR